MGRDATFGPLLRRYRLQAGLSQEELAAKAFVSTRAISDLERGVNARPRLHTAVALADGLGLAGNARAEFERHARPTDDAPEVAPPVSARARPPLTVDSFVDDGSSLDELLRLLGDRRNRLVTLVGPGGIGKTRLAIEAAHRLDGPVAFVDLTAVADANLFAASVGDALGVDHGPTRTHLQSLTEHLGARRLTLVLDNLEQIVEAAADIATLLRTCSELTVVATSRLPLRIAGEVLFAARPLGAEGDGLDDLPGVRLFLDRSGARRGADGPPGHAADLAAVAELCRRLDGLPLAIELAAARSRIVDPSEMLGHLDRVLDLLSVGRADAPEQHRSMHAALEWSYRLLPPAAQAALAALGAFGSSASAGAAAAVWGLPPGATGDYLDRVQALADAHLVTVESSGGAARLGMFETTRQFARHKLDESGAADSVHRRLADWAVDLVDHAEPGLSGPDQAQWLDTIDRELPNLRVAVRWLAAQANDEDMNRALRLVAGLPRFWEIRSRWGECATWLDELLGHSGGEAGARAKGHKALGVMHRCLGDLTAAEAELERAVALYAEAGDELGMASCLNNHGVIALDRAEYPAAGALFRQALDMVERLGDERLEGILLNNLALTTAETGTLREAFRLARRSRDLLLTHGNVSAAAWPEDNLASVLTLAGHPRWAAEIHHRTIRRRIELGDENGLWWALQALAEAWIALDETDLAGRALGFVAAHRERLGTVPVPWHDALTERRRRALIARVGPSRFAELWDEGTALDPGLVRAWFTD